MEVKKSHQIVFIGIVLLSILLVTAVHAISEAHKTVVIDPHSDHGRELTAIAEEAIAEEGIDTRYTSLQSIVQDSPDVIMLTFYNAERYSGGTLFSNTDFNEEKNVTFLALDIDRYDLHIQTNKKGVRKSETYGYGNNYLYSRNNNSIEMVNPHTNKTVFVLSDYATIIDKNKTNLLVDEINSKYDSVQLAPVLDTEEPCMIIDVTNDDREGWLFIYVAFYKGQLNSIHIEEGIHDFYKTTISHTAKYYDENGEVILAE